VNGAIAFWDPATQSYKFVTGGTQALEPNRGYWVFVVSSGLTLKYPEVTLLGAQIGRARGDAPVWQQTDKQYRLMLSARTATAIDDQNFVGYSSSTTSAKNLSYFDPPTGPTQSINVSIAPDTPNGTRLAQSITAGQQHKDWTVLVDAKNSEPVTLTWPNMSTVPRNVRFRITDVANNTSRDMRQTSGYTFTSQAGVTRQFKVTMDVGVIGRTVIGDVVVSRDARSPGGPVSISYALSSDATTSVRILSGSGREVRWITRGRADKVGQNTATWDLRDAAGRAVAPGTYRAEITATVDGQLVRRIVPINVIR
jgi:hypothetical protein